MKLLSGKPLNELIRGGASLWERLSLLPTRWPPGLSSAEPRWDELPCLSPL
jgi:hypothetical protein